MKNVAKLLNILAIFSGFTIELTWPTALVKWINSFCFSRQSDPELNPDFV